MCRWVSGAISFFFFKKATNTELVANKDISHMGLQCVVNENSPMLSANGSAETFLERKCVMETCVLKLWGYKQRYKTRECDLEMSILIFSYKWQTEPMFRLDPNVCDFKPNSSQWWSKRTISVALCGWWCVGPVRMPLAWLPSVEAVCRSSTSNQRGRVATPHTRDGNAAPPPSPSVEKRAISWNHCSSQLKLTWVLLLWWEIFNPISFHCGYDDSAEQIMWMFF